MTYTAPDGVPVPQGTDAFNPPAQLKDMADASVRYHNRFVVATTAERDALTYVSDGDLCYVTADDIEYVMSSGAWSPFPLIELGTPTGMTGYTWGANGNLFKFGGVVILNANIVKNTGTFTSATQIATLPAGFRPLKTVDVACAFANATTGWASIAPTGVVTIYFLGAASNAVYFGAPYQSA